MSEQVNHPSHYNIEGRKECIDEFVDKYGENDTVLWCIMTAEKYLYRAGTKEGNSEEQDLKKALWYINWVTSHNVLNLPTRLIDAYYFVSAKLLDRIQDYYNLRP